MYEYTQYFRSHSIRQKRMKNNQIPVFEDAFNLINQSLSLEVQNQKRETALLQSPVWYPERDSSRTPYSLTSMNSRL